MKAIVLITVALGISFTYGVTANTDYWSIEAVDADEAIFSYAACADFYSAQNATEFTPTTGNYESYVRHDWTEGELDSGSWLAIHLKTRSGYEQTIVRKIERVYTVSLPVITMFY